MYSSEYLMKTIKVSNGFVKGKVKNILGKPLVEFLSIPYCQAPTNERRFRKPEIPNFVNDIINDLQFKTCPPQIEMKIFDDNIDEKLWIPIEEQSENCLYLNIWCPLDILEGKEIHPVFVWIYGGGFVSGSSSLPVYNGSMLAVQENIIVVSFNYRVGVLGFLCLDEEICGNQGIYDQVAALKWVHDNIISFRGNPCNVTIGGNSAGGCSVTLHLIIEESWQYFNKIIVQSGVCLSDWAFLPKKELLIRSENLVNKLLKKHGVLIRWNNESETSTKDEIKTILRNMDFNEFLDDSILTKCILNFSWLPCVDGSLITDNSESLFQSKKFKKCPSVFLNVENEGTFFLLHQFPNMQIDENGLVDATYFDDCFKYYRWYPNKCPLSIKESIVEKYNINQQKISINILDKIISDRHFVSDSIRLANYVSENSVEVYYIWFNVTSQNINWPKWVGTMHSDEIYLLFGYDQFDSNETPNSMCKLYMDNIGYFIHNGSMPNQFPHYDMNSGNFILIENDDWTISKFSVDQKDKVTFWEKLRMQTD